VVEATAAELVPVPSATSVARSAILPVHAPRLPLEAEDTPRSVVDPKRLGGFFFPWYDSVTKIG
jgi:hypothetical protein